MSKEARKVVILDTNVILHDHECIKKFDEHDVVIPSIVLEELDRFKKGNEDKNYHARKFIHTLDVLRQERITKTIAKNKTKSISKLSNGGVSLGPDKGTIEVRITRKAPQAIQETFPEDMADNRILGLVHTMQKDSKEMRKVIFVTKDVNLRIKADVLGIEAEDYENDKVSTSDIYLGREIIENYPAEQLDLLYNSQEGFDMEILQKKAKDALHPNMYFALKNDKKSVLAHFDATKNMLTRIQKREISGIVPLNSEQAFATDALLNAAIQLISLYGMAGTGKTLLAMAAGLELLKEKRFDQIIIASATVPLSNKEIGYLPGNANDKVSPYMQGIFDNLDFIKNQLAKKDSAWLEKMMSQEKDGKIKIQNLASIRGRSINNTFFVIDEAQNLTPHEVKTIVTRAGKNTKMIFCGDVSQIDSPYLDAHSNGLSYLIAHMKSANVYAHITLEKGERSELADLAARLL